MLTFKKKVRINMNKTTNFLTSEEYGYLTTRDKLTGSNRKGC
jgi:hypothetical protein